jgi:murein DD-endopeptidase MepM/ murein hydrolase activator NlpD
MQTADGFDFPVGKPDGAGYWIVSGLAEQEYYKLFGSWHTGEDWNRGSGDADLGDPVYSVAHGKVNVARHFGGWGNVVLVEHGLPDGDTVWSQYAHLREMTVSEGQKVSRGDQVGTIGKGDKNKFVAHLHFEIRLRDLPAYKWGWKTEADRLEVLRSYAHPSDFISARRPGVPATQASIDETSEAFSRSESEYWQEAQAGHGKHIYWTWTVSAEQGEDCVAEWQPKLPHKGLYEVFAYIPADYATTRQARYRVTHGRGTAEVIVDQYAYSNEWVSLGTYAFSTARPAIVRLSDLTGEPYTRDRAQRKQIAFDTVKWVLRSG